MIDKFALLTLELTCTEMPQNNYTKTFMNYLENLRKKKKAYEIVHEKQGNGVIYEENKRIKFVFW
jgi:hypothetical protein